MHRLKNYRKYIWPTVLPLSGISSIWLFDEMLESQDWQIVLFTLSFFMFLYSIHRTYRSNILAIPKIKDSDDAWEELDGKSKQERKVIEDVNRIYNKEEFEGVIKENMNLPSYDKKRVW